MMTWPFTEKTITLFFLKVGLDPLGRKKLNLFFFSYLFGIGLSFTIFALADKALALATYLFVIVFNDDMSDKIL